MEQMQQNEIIQQFQKLLEENDRPQQARDFSQLMWLIDGMERQFDTVVKELQEVKQQLAQVKDRQSPVKKALTGMVRALENKVAQARERLQSVREKIVDGAAQAVEGFKRTGVAALDKTLSVLGVKRTLGLLQRDFSRLSKDTKATIQKVESIGQELRSVGGHLKNAGRAAIGKDTKEIDGGQEGHFQAGLLAPLRVTQKLYAGLNNAALAAIGNVERLEEAAAAGRDQKKKPSIRKDLAEKQAQTAARPEPAPEAEKKPVEASL